MDSPYEAHADALGNPAQNEGDLLDDIYVPGLGVRGALGDDEPRTSPRWPRLRERWVRAGGLANHQVRARFKSFRTRLASTRLPEFRAAATHSKSAFIRFYTVADRTVSRSARASMARASHYVRLQRARVSSTARDRFEACRIWQPDLQPISHAVARCLRRSSTWLRQYVVQGRVLLRRFASRLRMLDRCELSWANLRHAVPELSILILTMLFMIQRIVAAARR